MADILGGLSVGLTSGLFNYALGLNREEIAANRQFSHSEQAAVNADSRARKMYMDFMSPEAVLRQYKSAGLSPSLMFGGGGVGGQTPSGAQGSGSHQGSMFQPIDPISAAEIAKTMAETENIKANTTKTEKETELTNEQIKQTIADTENKHLINIYQSIQNEIADDTKDLTKEEAEWKVKRMQQDFENFEYIMTSNRIRAKIDEATADEIIKQTFLESQQKALEIALSNKELNLKDAEIEKISAEISKIAFDKQAELATYKRDKQMMEIEAQKWLQELKLKEAEIGVTATKGILSAIAGAILLRK